MSKDFNKNLIIQDDLKDQIDIPSQKLRRIYKPPQLIQLDTIETQTGSANVPEGSNGLLAS